MTTWFQSTLPLKWIFWASATQSTCVVGRLVEQGDNWILFEAAFDSKGGKSIIALRSTADNGEISRVVPRLEAGTAITIPRMDTHYLATEYGAANLKGKSTHDRALAIIELAHPKFREDLLRQADRMNLLHGVTLIFEI